MFEERKVVLCISETDLANPHLVGLPNENLEAQPWLKIASKARQARDLARRVPGVKEVWVASCDDMNPINVAAAIKKDGGNLPVFFLAKQGSGSLYSRANAAGLNGALSHQAFAARYKKAKSVLSKVEAASVPKHEAPAAQLEECSFELTEPVMPAHVVQGACCDPELAEDYGSESAKITEVLPVVAPRPVAAMPKGSRKAFILSVVSGSGGAGKSTVAAMSAFLAARNGMKTLLLDLDLQFGDAPALLGAEKPLAIDVVLSNPSAINHVQVPQGMPYVISAPVALEYSEVVVSRVPGLIEMLSSHFDVIVVNTGSFWSELQIAVLERSACSLFLVDQRVSSLKSCRRVLELCGRCGLATSPFLFVANRCSKSAVYSSIDVSCAMQGARAVELRDGGDLVEELLCNGMAEELYSSKNEFVNSLNTLMLEILPIAEARREEVLAAERESKGLFGRKTRKKARKR